MSPLKRGAWGIVAEGFGHDTQVSARLLREGDRPPCKSGHGSNARGQAAIQTDHEKRGPKPPFAESVETGSEAVAHANGQAARRLASRSFDLRNVQGGVVAVVHGGEQGVQGGALAQV